MSGPAIIWTPAGSSTPRTIDLSSVGVKRFQPVRVFDKARSVTPSRIAVTLIHGAYWSFGLEFTGFDRANDRVLFSALRAFDSFALAGGIFAFTWNASLVTSTTLTSGALDTASAVVLTSTTGFANGHWVAYEDAFDPSVYSRGEVNVVTDGTHLTVKDALGVILSSTSTFRHEEYFQYCQLVEEKSPFVERDAAGDGAGLWDFKGTIETVKP